MIEKRKNSYSLLLQEVKLKDGSEQGRTLAFEFDNHDDVFDIIDKIQSKNIFGSKNHDVEFALGLKLFSEVMLRHKDHLLFEEFRPAFGRFMKKLKNTSATGE